MKIYVRMLCDREGAQVGNRHAFVRDDPFSVFQVKPDVGVRQLPEREGKNEDRDKYQWPYPLTWRHFEKNIG
jgi:hypothetical protein